MDTTRFDRILMTFAQEQSRRGLLRFLGSGALAAGGLTFLDAAESEAKKRRKRKRKRKKKKKGPNCNGKCGGSCPRCAAGSACTDRDECTTALCEANVCTEPVDNPQCGLDTDGVNGCFRRGNLENGESYCSRQTCRFIGAGSCNECTGQEVCSPAGDPNIECCLPCGSPL